MISVLLLQFFSVGCADEMGSWALDYCAGDGHEYVSGTNLGRGDMSGMSAIESSGRMFFRDAYTDSDLSECAGLG